jgi:hypothetical protein
MILKDWLNLNPNHQVTLAGAPGDRVRAVLSGGNGIDQYLVGDGNDEAIAIRHALENRDAMQAQLP